MKNMKNNQLVTEELERILEIMHGGDFMPKGIILEGTSTASRVFMKAFVKRVTSKTGYGLLGDAQVSKWFETMMADLNKQFPKLRWNPTKKTWDQASWDDALEFMLATDRLESKYLVELFEIRVIQQDIMAYMKVAYKGGMTKVGSESFGMRKFIDETLDGKFDKIFSSGFKDDLSTLMKLLRDSLGKKFLNKVKMGDFSGMRQILSWWGPGHQNWVNEFMPNLSVFGAKGKGHELNNLFKLTYGAITSPITLLKMGIQKLPAKLIPFVIGVFRWGALALGVNYLFKMITTALSSEIHHIMLNGAQIYEDSGPLARHLFKIKDSKATEIATWIHDEVDDFFVDEKGIQGKLKEAGSKYGICQVCHTYERQYKDKKLWSDIQSGARISRLSLEKISPFPGVSDYSDIVIGLEGMVEVTKNEKNAELVKGIKSVLEIPKTDAFMEEGPLVIDNGNHAAYYKKGKYPPADIIFRLGEYFYLSDNTYDDSTFRDELKVMSIDNFKSALSSEAGQMLIVPGKEEYGDFKPSSAEYTAQQEELLKENQSEIRQTFDDTILQLEGWMENLVSSIS